MIYQNHFKMPVRKSAVCSVLSILIFCTFLYALYRRIQMLESTNQEKIQMEAYFVKPDQGPDLSILPNIAALEWPSRKYASVYTLREIFNQKPYEPQMSALNERLFTHLLDTFSQIMLKNKLANTWFLHFGTLLGSMRHHDYIPWDDDVDILTSITNRRLIQREIRKLAPLILLYEQGKRDKIYGTLVNDSNIDVMSSRKVPGYPFGWPSVDICYYEHRGGYLHELQQSDGRYYSFNPKLVFPLIYRPFGKKWYPTPSRPISFLKEIYTHDDNTCKSNVYSHAFERVKAFNTSLCSSLADRFAFVTRTEDNSHGYQYHSKFVWIAEKLVTLSPELNVIHTIPMIIHSKDAAMIHAFSLNIYHTQT